jgi:hypothetical protein
MSAPARALQDGEVARGEMPVEVVDVGVHLEALVAKGG